MSKSVKWPLPYILLAILSLCSPALADGKAFHAFYGRSTLPMWSVFPEDLYKSEELRLRGQLTQLKKDGATDLGKAVVLENLARLYLSHGKNKKAATEAHRAISLLSRQSDHEELARALTVEALIYDKEGKLALAQHKLSEAFAAAEGDSLKREVLSIWLSLVPGNTEVAKQLAALARPVSEPISKSASQSEAHALFYLASLPSDSERAAATYDEAFAKYALADDVLGMLNSLAKIVEHAGPTTRLDKWNSMMTADTRAQIDKLFACARMHIADRTARSVLESSALKIAMRKYAISAEPQQAYVLLNVWKQALDEMDEKDALQSLRLRRTQAIVLSLLARADWRLNRISEAEADYRQSMNLSQKLYEDATANKEALERSKAEFRVNVMRRLYIRTGRLLTDDVEFAITPIVPSNYAKDKAFAQLGLAGLLCSQNKFYLAEEEYNKARALPVGLSTTSFCGLVTDIAEGYLSTGKLVDARRNFAQIKKYFGSYSLIPFKDCAFEDPITGPNPSESSCVDKCTTFMRTHPEPDDSAVLARFHEFQMSRLQ